MARQPFLMIETHGRSGTLTHDYKRHGTTTLFAATNVLVRKVVGLRYQELIRFLNAGEPAAPVGNLFHSIIDNHATHKYPKVRAWLARHLRRTFHFTPSSALDRTNLKKSDNR
jgi:hypothetical protein